MKIRKMNKKSQAALEFLMTYGWAILVVLVAVGALAYFGVLSPDKFLPTKCTLQPGIACIDHKVDGTASTLIVVIQNALGYDISGVSVSATGCTTPAIAPATLANGARGTYTVSTCTFSGTKYSGDLTVDYTIAETGLTHKNKGSVVTKVD